MLLDAVGAWSNPGGRLQRLRPHVELRAALSPRAPLYAAPPRVRLGAGGRRAHVRPVRGARAVGVDARGPAA
eukprot:2196651-Prymnesium_polylepis.1